MPTIVHTVAESLAGVDKHWSWDPASGSMQFRQHRSYPKVIIDQFSLPAHRSSRLRTLNLLCLRHSTHKT